MTATVKEIATNTLVALNAQLTYRGPGGDTIVNTGIVDKITGLLNSPVVIQMYAEEKSIPATKEITDDESTESV